MKHRVLGAAFVAAGVFAVPTASRAHPPAAAAPTPIEQAVPADWVAVFKFNARTAPTTAPDSQRPCPFGGTPAHNGGFSQAYAAATSAHPKLDAGPGLAGTSLNDPLG